MPETNVCYSGTAVRTGMDAAFMQQQCAVSRRLGQILLRPDTAPLQAQSDKHHSRDHGPDDFHTRAFVPVERRVEQPRRDAGGGSEDIVREFSALADTVLPNLLRNGTSEPKRRVPNTTLSGFSFSASTTFKMSATVC